jgi:hypothetical protein
LVEQEDKKRRREEEKTRQVSDRIVPQTDWETRTPQVEQATASEETNQQTRMKKKTLTGRLNRRFVLLTEKDSA